MGTWPVETLCLKQGRQVEPKISHLDPPHQSTDVHWHNVLSLGFWAKIKSLWLLVFFSGG